MKTSGVKTENIMKKFGLTKSKLLIFPKNRNNYKKLKRSFFLSFSKMKKLMAMSRKYKKLEQRLLIWVRELKNQGLSLDELAFKRKAMDWYREMGPSYPFRAYHIWIRHFQRTHKIEVTFQGNKSEKEEEDKVVQIEPNSEIKANQSENKDEKLTELDEEATMNAKNDENKELEKEKEKFFLKLFLLSKNRAVSREEKKEQGIQKDVEKKNRKEIKVKTVEFLNPPIFKRNVNEDDTETTNPITGNEVFPFGIIENKKEKIKILAHESNKRLMNVFAGSDDLNDEEKEKEFLCDFSSTSENSTKNVNDEKQVCLDVGLQNSIVLKNLRDEANEKLKNSALKKKFEQRLLKWLKNARKIGFTVQVEIFRNIALKYYKQSGISNYFTASRMWIYRFEKRYNIKVVNKLIKPSKRTWLYLSDNSITQREKMNRNKEINKAQVKIEQVKTEENEEVNNIISFKTEFNQKKELDQNLLNWLSEMRSQRLEVNGKMFQEEALKLHKSLSHTYYFKGHYHWICSFEKRYQVQIICHRSNNDSKKHQLKEIGTKDCERDEIESLDEKYEKILEFPCQKQGRGESISSKDQNSNAGSISMTRKSVIQKSSSIVGLDDESVRKCDLASIRDSDSSSSSSSSSLLKSHLKFGVNNIKIKEPLELLDKELIREEKVSREVEDDWKEEVVKIAKDEGKYRKDYEQQKLEEEIGEKELENVQTENIEIKDLKVEGTEIREVNAIDEEKNVKKKIDEKKECEEEKEKDEVDTEDDKNNDLVSYDLLKRSDVSEKLILDKLEEEIINVDKEMQVDADDMTEENLTEEQVKVNKENLAMNGEEKEKDEEEIVEVEKDEDNDSSSCGLFLDLNVSENLIVNETDEEKEVQDKNVNLATMEVFVDEKEEMKEKIMVTECEEEVEHKSKEQEVELSDKDLVINVEEDQKKENNRKEEIEDEENIRNEVKNFHVMRDEENEMAIVEDEVDNLEIEKNKEEIEEQHLKRKKKTFKLVTFATDVEIINAQQSPTNCPSLESSPVKPVNKNINMKEYVEILEYKLVFSKCKQFIKDQNIRQYFRRHQIKEFGRAMDILIEKATSEDDLLDDMLMNKNWAPFGRMFCSEDIARVCEGKIICTFCYEDDKDEYKNYSKSSINHKLTSNRKLRGRICDKCKETTVDFRPAAKCIECIIPFWRSKSYYKLLFCNEIGNLKMTSEQLLLINSILTNMHEFEY